MKPLVNKPTTEKKSQADRGKYAEGKVREVLNILKRQYTDFDFERQYDFRASRGRIPPQTATSPSTAVATTGRWK